MNVALKGSPELVAVNWLPMELCLSSGSSMWDIMGHGSCTSLHITHYLGHPAHWPCPMGRQDHPLALSRRPPSPTRNARRPDPMSPLLSVFLASQILALTSYSRSRQGPCSFTYCHSFQVRLSSRSLTVHRAWHPLPVLLEDIVEVYRFPVSSFSAQPHFRQMAACQQPSLAQNGNRAY